MSIYTSESPETLTDTVQRAHAVREESLFSSLCNMPERDERIDTPDLRLEVEQASALL